MTLPCYKDTYTETSYKYASFKDTGHKYTT